MTDSERLEALIRKLPPRRVFTDAEYGNLTDYLRKTANRYKRSHQSRLAEAEKFNTLSRLIADLRKYKPRVPQELSDNIQTLIVRAKAIIEDRGPISIPPVEHGKGRYDQRARKKAEAAAQVFWEVKGKRAGASKEMLNFLQRVFDISSIRTRAASQKRYLLSRPIDIMRILID